MEFGLKGKRAIVMAASRGLGYASALGLAREGCQPGDLQPRPGAHRGGGGGDSKGNRRRGDRRSSPTSAARSEAKRLVDAAVSAYGGLEIVVHNAGGPPAGETLAMTEEQWQKAFEQNLLSFTRIVGAAAPEMKKAGYGRVLTIASSSIKQPIPNLALSNALRAGVWGIAKTLSRELAPQGILVNVIAPGRIDTERIAELDQANAQKSGKSIEDVRKASVASIPLGRLGRPEELANLVVFLASRSGQLHHGPGDHGGWRGGQCAVSCSLVACVRARLQSCCIRALAQARRSPCRAPPVEEPRPEFSEFVAQLKEQALAARRERGDGRAALANLEPLEVVVERDRIQAGSRADDRSVRVAPADADVRAHRRRQAARASRASSRRSRRSTACRAACSWRSGAWNRTSAASPARGRRAGARHAGVGRAARARSSRPS